jgi:hypothetical protein
VVSLKTQFFTLELALFLSLSKEDCGLQKWSGFWCREKSCVSGGLRAVDRPVKRIVGYRNGLGFGVEKNLVSLAVSEQRTVQ